MTTIALLLVAGLAVHAAVWNYFAYGRPAPKQGAATVVVLGCKVNGDQPSLMLRRRLECALEYLRANEQAVCVVSGGQGSNESYSEAYVMEKFLVENGVAPERVEQEALSTNTDSNIANSLQLIEQKDCRTASFYAPTDFISCAPGCTFSATPPGRWQMPCTAQLSPAGHLPRWCLPMRCGSCLESLSCCW